MLSYIIAICGVALLLGGVASFQRDKLLGDFLGLTAGAAYGAYLLVVGRFRHQMPTSLVMGVTTLSCACSASPGNVCDGRESGSHYRLGLGYAPALALITHAGGQGLLVFAMKYFAAFTSSVTLLLQPVVAACGAWILFGETLGAWQVFGGAVVLFGILLCQDATTRGGANTPGKPKKFNARN